MNHPKPCDTPEHSVTTQHTNTDATTPRTRSRNKGRSKGAVEERERQITEMWLAGFSLDETAERLNINRSTVHRARVRVAARRTAEWDPSRVDELVTMELARIDRLMRPHLLAALQGDTRAAEFALRCIDRRIRLLGLDAPTKIDATVRSELDAEIEQMIEQMRDAGVTLPATEPRT